MDTEVGKLRYRNPGTSWSRHERAYIVSVVPHVANIYGIALEPFNRLGYVHATYFGLDYIIPKTKRNKIPHSACRLLKGPLEADSMAGSAGRPYFFLDH